MIRYFEAAFRTIGAKMQIQIWTYLLRSLATQLGVEPDIAVHQACVDEKMQWGEAKNVWYNAQIRTLLYLPVHLARKAFKRKK